MTDFERGLAILTLQQLARDEQEARELDEALDMVMYEMEMVGSDA